jgi:chemotaxis protein histidine kinase CheA
VTTSVEKVNGTTVAPPERGFDAVALAEADAIRARTAAETEAALLKAQAEADAIRAKAEADAEKQRLANRRQAMALEEKEADHAAKLADAERRRKEAERLARQEEEQAAAEQQAAEQQAADVAEAEDRWRGYALNFYRVCAIVALPVQVSAFYNPRALWLMAAPLMLEGGAWVVLKGAAAAVANRQPSWHYRLIAWLLAFVAAGINLWHGLHAFDPATALGTAFASIAGPGVWDLHEHGRIRKRDGVLTRRERRAQRNQDRAEAARKAAEEKRRRAEQEAADEAAKAAREELIEERKREFPKVWAEAVKIGAALGKAPDDPAVWPRAYRNIEGTDPGESIESITARRAAEKRVEAALTGTPVSTLSKTTKAQRGVQTPRSGYKPVPPRRTKGDTPRYNRAAGRAHGELLRAKNARQKDPS